MVWGLTDTGFRKKVFTDIWEDTKARIRAIPGLSRINLLRETFLGGVVATVSLAMSEDWDALQELYSAGDPDGATFRALENLMAIVGKYRRPATATLVSTTVNLDIGTYAAGDLIASVYGKPTVQFRNRDAVTRAGSTGNETVVFVCQTTGAIPAPLGTLTVIQVAVVGWNSITNPADGVPGREIETDAELRARRLVFSSTETLATDSRVLKLFIFDNNTDSTVDSRPPHSFEAVVYDGTAAPDPVVMSNLEIAQLLFRSKPAGIATVGDITVTVEDSNGDEHDVKFSRPTVLDVYLKVTLTEGAGWDDTSGPIAVKDALVAFGDALFTCGSTVVRSALFGPAMSVAGVFDVTAITLGLASNPATTANIAATAKQIPKFDAANIIVVHA